MWRTFRLEQLWGQVEPALQGGVLRVVAGKICIRQGTGTAGEKQGTGLLICGLVQKALTTQKQEVLVQLLEQVYSGAGRGCVPSQGAGLCTTPLESNGGRLANAAGEQLRAARTRSCQTSLAQRAWSMVRRCRCRSRGKGAGSWGGGAAPRQPLLAQRAAEGVGQANVAAAVGGWCVGRHNAICARSSNQRVAGDATGVSHMRGASLACCAAAQCSAVQCSAPFPYTRATKDGNERSTTAG